MNRSLFVLPFLATSFLFGSNEDRVSLLECKMKAVRDSTVFEGRDGARFANGRPVLDSGWGVWATGEVLYWKTYEGGTDVAAFNIGTSPNIFGDVKKLDFEWEAGYRLGLSYSWPQDNWDLSLLFTRISPQADILLRSIDSGTSFVTIITPDFIDATNITASWNIKLSTLDFEMGRSYFLSRYFYVRPHFGARGAWIHQKASGLVSNDTDTEELSFRNDFDGGGIRVGADMKWFLDRHWNLGFNSSFSGLWGSYKVVNRRNQTGGTAYHSDYTLSDARFAITGQALIALGWETFFARNRNHLALSLGYEMNYWWRQNQLFAFENRDSTPYGSRYADDLGFQGLTFDVQLSF